VGVWEAAGRKARRVKKVRELSFIERS